MKETPVNVIMFKYNIQPKKYMHNVKNNTISFISPIDGANEVPRTETACVPTAAINHAPLIPSAKLGFSCRIVIKVKNVYITTTQRKMAIIHKMKGITTYRSEERRVGKK